jgi:hypothetical protein
MGIFVLTFSPMLPSGTYLISGGPRKLARVSSVPMQIAGMRYNERNDISKWLNQNFPAQMSIREAGRYSNYEE